MSLLVRTLGYESLMAANGNEAVKIATREIPDLILMDIALPDIDGLTVTEILRKSFDSSKMPILALTAHGKFISTEAAEAGCNDVITKPVSLDSLESILSHYLKCQ